MKRIFNIQVCLCMVLLGGSLLFFSSCSKEQDVVVTDVIPLPAFDTIRLYAVFDVELIQADTFSLQIRVVPDVLPGITYEVKDKTLSFDNSNTSLWTDPKSNPPVLVIRGKHIRHVDAIETCSITSLNTITTPDFGISLGGKLNFADLKVDNHYFYYWSSSPCGGLVKVTGHTEYLHIYNINLMAVHAENFICRYAIVENSSKSDVRVFVSDQLHYSITGTGNIYLNGNPPDIFKGEVTSTGRLIF